MSRVKTMARVLMGLVCFRVTAFIHGQVDFVRKLSINVRLIFHARIMEIVFGMIKMQLTYAIANSRIQANIVKTMYVMLSQTFAIMVHAMHRM